jgi:hypothetical protein
MLFFIVSLLALPALLVNAEPCISLTWKNAGGCTGGLQLQYKTSYRTDEISGCTLQTQKVPCAAGRRLLVINKDCIYSDFPKYGACVGGFKSKSRVVLQEAIGNGIPCDNSPASLTRTQPCANCVMTDWVNSGGCVNNLQTQTRKKVSDPVNGGDKCGVKTRQIACGAQTLIGSYNVFTVPDGQYNENSPLFWPNNPPSYSCLDACAIVFGGNAIDYSCSTTATSIDHQAHYDGWGRHDCYKQIYAENFKQPSDGSTYNCQVDSCAWSAYIMDGCPHTLNYCWKSV